MGLQMEYSDDCWDPEDGVGCVGLKRGGSGSESTVDRYSRIVLATWLSIVVVDVGENGTMLVLPGCATEADVTNESTVLRDEEKNEELLMSKIGANECCSMLLFGWNEGREVVSGGRE